MRRRDLLTALTLIAIAGFPGTGTGHALLVRSVPARRAMLHQSPDRVQLWFSERLEPQFSRVRVVDGGDQPVDRGDSSLGLDDPRRLEVSLPELSAGSYRARFRVLSVDGHVVQGEVPFTIVPPRRG